MALQNQYHLVLLALQRDSIMGAGVYQVLGASHG